MLEAATDQEGEEEEEEEEEVMEAWRVQDMLRNRLLPRMTTPTAGKGSLKGMSKGSRDLRHEKEIEPTMTQGFAKIETSELLCRLHLQCLPNPPFPA